MSTNPHQMNKKWLAGITIGLLILISLLLKDYLSLEYLKSSKETLSTFINHYFLLSVGGFLVLCALMVNSPIPLAGFIKVFSGFAFGLGLGTVLNIIGTFIGAFVGFLAARYLFRESLEKDYEERLKSLDEAMDKNGHWYLLFLRLTMLAPYFIIHILGGISKMKLKPYLISTLIGVIPSSIIYSYTGVQIEKVNSIKDVLSYEMIAIILLFILMAFTPRLIKAIQVRYSDQGLKQLP